MNAHHLHVPLSCIDTWITLDRTLYFICRTHNQITQWQVTGNSCLLDMALQMRIPEALCEVVHRSAAALNALPP